MPKTSTKGGKRAGKEGGGKDGGGKKAAPKAVSAASPAADEPAPPAVAAPEKKPSRSRYHAVEDPPPVVPARRLTPEAKARVNAMVAKGVSLQEALRAAASWETFVAPVKEEPAKLVQGKPGEAPRPAAPRVALDDDAAEDKEGLDEAPSGDSDE